MGGAAGDCAEPVCSTKAGMLRAVGMFGGGGAKACPADREELGRASWTLLHTLAAYYPDSPTRSQQLHARMLFHALGELYPCRHCAEDLREGMVSRPPRVGSREELSVWVCEQHNRVNEALGKAQHECTLAALDRRWRTGAPGCFKPAADAPTAAETLGHE
mmetsp:Transcript_24488/g.79942  ORF Transcript_24488/g.79942 Transcript_24488/m.79942 type:complete len:161 (-) Transcript_24488:61-543(-)